MTKTEQEVAYWESRVEEWQESLERVLNSVLSENDNWTESLYQLRKDLILKKIEGLVFCNCCLTKANYSKMLEQKQLAITTKDTILNE
jgi:hypothetical protein